jgi:hypothetical protein
MGLKYVLESWWWYAGGAVDPLVNRASRQALPAHRSQQGQGTGSDLTKYGGYAAHSHQGQGAADTSPAAGTVPPTTHQGQGAADL